jgi:hypothetical protein
MTQPVLDGLPEWTEMLDQVLVTSSIDPVSAKLIPEWFRCWWEADLAALVDFDSFRPLSDTRPKRGRRATAR